MRWATKIHFYEDCIIETLVIRPSKFHKKNNTEGGDEHCQAMHFK